MANATSEFLCSGKSSATFANTVKPPRRSTTPQRSTTHSPSPSPRKPTTSPSCPRKLPRQRPKPYGILGLAGDTLKTSSQRQSRLHAQFRRDHNSPIRGLTSSLHSSLFPGACTGSVAMYALSTPRLPCLASSDTALGVLLLTRKSSAALMLPLSQ